MDVLSVKKKKKEIVIPCNIYMKHVLMFFYNFIIMQ